MVAQGSAGAAGAGIGLAIGGPTGALIGSVFGAVLPDVFSRKLGAKEKERIEKVAEMAQREIEKRLKAGKKVKKTLSRERIGTILEGALLVARDSYEEKKMPLLANLVAVSMFTNTPEVNQVQALKNAEQLSYRQLCILAVIGRNQWYGKLGLNDKSYKGKYEPLPRDEERDGVYFDVLSLINDGFLVQMEADNHHIIGHLVLANIIPSRLRLYYPGKLLFNGMQLDNVEKKDFNHIVNLLK